MRCFVLLSTQQLSKSLRSETKFENHNANFSKPRWVTGDLVEWLIRLTRNQLPFWRVGSSPAVVDSVFVSLCFILCLLLHPDNLLLVDVLIC